MRGVLVLSAILAAAGLLQALDANPAASQSAVLRALAADKDPGLDPAAGAWERAPKVPVTLNAQPGAYAAGGGSIPSLSAQAVHYKGTLYLRLEWEDATNDASTARPTEFADAVAVEFPARAATSVPSICMGQADQGVNIWFWRADSDAGIDEPLKVFDFGFVDWYPDESEDVWFPARAAGNPFAQPDGGPVQDLVARAFGTIGPAGAQLVDGKGVHASGKWAVVLTRPFDTGDADQAKFGVGTETDMAFAVWNGSEGDRNGRKSVSQFLRLNISAAQVAAGGGAATKWLWLAAGLLAASVALGVGLAAYGARKG